MKYEYILLTQGYSCDNCCHTACSKRSKDIIIYSCSDFFPEIETLWNELDEAKEMCHEWNI